MYAPHYIFSLHTPLCLSDLQDEEENNGDDEEYDFIPKMGCMKTDAWEYGIDSVADRILWDRDFEMEAQFEARGGGSAHGLMRMMGIDQEYFQKFQGRARPGARDRLYQMCRRLGD